MILARTLPGLHNKFKGNLGNLVRLYFKKEVKRKADVKLCGRAPT